MTSERPSSATGASAPEPPVVEVSGLTKRYGATLAVDDLSFSVCQGQVLGFLGPNGAGKSTTLRILAGFLAQTRGHVRVCGHDLQEDSLEARRCVGYMPEAAPLYPEMRVVEYLAFRAELKGVTRNRQAAVDDAMAKAGVTDRATSVIGKLSKGYRQRVGLADALVASPRVLVLDEPTAGLDPNQIRDVRKLLCSLGKDHTVILSTHILSEVESTCTHAVVIARGKLVAAGSIEEIRRLRRAGALLLTVRGKGALSTLEGLGVFARVEEVEADGDATVLRCVWKVDGDPEAVVAALVAAGVGVRAVVPEQSSLEDVFAELTRGDP